MSSNYFALISACIFAYAVMIAHAQNDETQAASASSSSSAAAAASTEPQCGTPETDYAPCLARERADSLFRHCCQQYAPEGCQSLCTYESDELTARNNLLQSVKAGKCDLKHVSTILYCASQNQVISISLTTKNTFITITQLLG